MDAPPPGWHNDPTGRFKSRFWDGRNWTEHVMYGHGEMMTDPVIPPPGSIGAYAPNSTLVHTSPLTMQSTVQVLLVAFAVLLPLFFLAFMGMQARTSVGELAQDVRSVSCARLAELGDVPPECGDGPRLAGE